MSASGEAGGKAVGNPQVTLGEGEVEARRYETNWGSGGPAINSSIQRRVSG